MSVCGVRETTVVLRRISLRRASIFFLPKLDRDRSCKKRLRRTRWALRSINSILNTAINQKMRKKKTNRVIGTMTVEVSTLYRFVHSCRPCFKSTCDKFHWESLEKEETRALGWKFLPLTPFTARGLQK